MDCSLPCSSVHGILQARTLEWILLLQGIFLTQGLDLCLFSLLPWQAGSLLLVPPGKLPGLLQNMDNAMRLFKKYLFLFIWLYWVLVVACEILFPDQGLNPGPLHWEFGVLITGPLGKFLQ